MTGPLVVLAGRDRHRRVRSALRSPRAPFFEWVLLRRARGAPSSSRWIAARRHSPRRSSASAGVASVYSPRRERRSAHAGSVAPDDLLEHTLLHRRLLLRRHRATRCATRVSAAVYWFNQHVLDAVVNGAGTTAPRVSRAVVIWFDRERDRRRRERRAGTAMEPSAGLLQYDPVRQRAVVRRSVCSCGVVLR